MSVGSLMLLYHQKLCKSRLLEEATRASLEVACARQALESTGTKLCTRSRFGERIYALKTSAGGGTSGFLLLRELLHLTSHRLMSAQHTRRRHSRPLPRFTKYTIPRTTFG